MQILHNKLHSGGTRLVYAVHQSHPSFAEVGLACETTIALGHEENYLELANINVDSIS